LMISVSLYSVVLIIKHLFEFLTRTSVYLSKVPDISSDTLPTLDFHV